MEWDRAIPEFEDLPHGTAEEKRRELFEHQKHTLDTFLAHGAITKAQYDKSLCDLKEKMGMNGVE